MARERLGALQVNAFIIEQLNEFYEVLAKARFAGSRQQLEEGRSFLTVKLAASITELHNHKDKLQKDDAEKAQKNKKTPNERTPSCRSSSSSTLRHPKRRFFAN